MGGLELKCMAHWLSILTTQLLEIKPSSLMVVEVSQCENKSLLVYREVINKYVDE